MVCDEKTLIRLSFAGSRSPISLSVDGHYLAQITETHTLAVRKPQQARRAAKYH